MRRGLGLIGMGLVTGIGVSILVHEIAEFEIPFTGGRLFSCDFERQCDQTGLCSAISQKTFVDFDDYGEPYIWSVGEDIRHPLQRCALASVEAYFSPVASADGEPSASIVTLTIADNGGARFVKQEGSPEQLPLLSIQLGTCQRQ